MPTSPATLFSRFFLSIYRLLINVVCTSRVYIVPFFCFFKALPHPPSNSQPTFSRKKMPDYYIFRFAWRATCPNQNHKSLPHPQKKPLLSYASSFVFFSPFSQREGGASLSLIDWAFSLTAFYDVFVLRTWRTACSLLIYSSSHVFMTVTVCIRDPYECLAFCRILISCKGQRIFRRKCYNMVVVVFFSLRPLQFTSCIVGFVED